MTVTLTTAMSCTVIQHHGLPQPTVQCSHMGPRHPPLHVDINRVYTSQGGVVYDTLQNFHATQNQR